MQKGQAPRAQAVVGAAAQALQKEATGILRKIDADLKELERCVLARGSQTIPESKTKDLSLRLQEHRQTIRKWAGRGGLHADLQRQLAAARVRIETQLRKLKDLGPERELHTEVQEATFRHACPEAPPADLEASGSESLEGSSPSEQRLELPSQEGDLVKECGEVKICVEQLVVDGESDASEFVCQICQTHAVGCGPKMTSCSHLFCGDCIDKWISVHKSGQSYAARSQLAGGVPCPVCKEPIRAEQDLHLVSPEGQGGSGMLWHIISATPVRCANHSKCSPNGLCNWVGTYGSFQQHIRTCTNSPLEDFMEPVAQAAAQEVSEEAQPAVSGVVVAEATETVAPGDWEDREEEVSGSLDNEHVDEPAAMRRSESFASDPEDDESSALEEREARQPQAASPGTQLANDLSNLGDGGGDQLGSGLAGDGTGEGLGLSDEAGEANLTELLRQLFDAKVEAHHKESPGSTSTNGSSYDSGSSHGSPLIMEAKAGPLGCGGVAAASPLEATSDLLAQMDLAAPGKMPAAAPTVQGKTSKHDKQKAGKPLTAEQQKANTLQAAWAHAAQTQAQAQYYSQLQYHYQMAQWQQARSTYAGQVATQLRAAALAAKQP